MTTPTPEVGDRKVVEVKSAFSSKISWTAIISALAGIAIVFGLPAETVDAEAKAKIVAGIVTFEGVIITVLRTFFTNTVTPAAMERLQASKDAAK